MKASRDYFFEKVGKVMQLEDVYIVSADLAGRPFDYIRDKFPERYVPVGIAEQNMISVACGIALCGKKVIAYTSNPFISFHAFEQVRNGVSLMNLPVTIVGVGVGFGIAEYGTTHFITEDFSMMSLCPNIKIITVSDNTVAEKAYEEFLNCKSPAYLRFDKQCGDEIGTITDEEYIRGFRYIKQGSGKLIISTGYMSHLAKSILGGEAIEAIIDLFSYPFDSEALISEIKKFENIVVYEEQQKRGGLGSAILEILNETNIKANVTLKGVDYNGRFPSVYGSRNYWIEKYGLNPERWNKE